MVGHVKAQLPDFGGPHVARVRWDFWFSHRKALLPDFGGLARGGGGTPRGVGVVVCPNDELLLTPRGTSFHCFGFHQFIFSGLGLPRVLAATLASAWRKRPDSARSVPSTKVRVPTCSAMRRSSRASPS